MPGRKLGYKSSGITRRNVKAEYFCYLLNGEYNVIVNDQRWELREARRGYWLALLPTIPTILLA